MVPSPPSHLVLQDVNDQGAMWLVILRHQQELNIEIDQDAEAPRAFPGTEVSRKIRSPNQVPDVRQLGLPQAG